MRSRAERGRPLLSGLWHSGPNFLGGHEAGGGSRPTRAVLPHLRTGRLAHRPLPVSGVQARAPVHLPSDAEPRLCRRRGQVGNPHMLRGVLQIACTIQRFDHQEDQGGSPMCQVQDDELQIPMQGMWEVLLRTSRGQDVQRAQGAVHVLRLSQLRRGLREVC